MSAASGNKTTNVIDIIIPCDLRRDSVGSTDGRLELLPLLTPALELATGAWLALVPDGREPPDADAVGLLLSPDAEADAEAEAEALGLASLEVVMNGFDELPPVPEVRSKLNPPCELCCRMVADVSVESRALPPLYAQIQLLELSVALILLPMHESHRMLATREPSELTRDPSRTEILALESNCGST